jgi:hypothetical protein
MRRWVVVSVLLLAACGQKSSLPSTEGNTTPNEAVAANTANEVSANAALNAVQANVTAVSNKAQGGNALDTLPPANAALRFVGLWATDAANCASHGWHFTADRLDATDGPHCNIYKVTRAPGGYDLAAQCPEKKPIPTDLIKLRFAESARAMLVESNAIKPTGLIYCGK